MALYLQGISLEKLFLAIIRFLNSSQALNEVYEADIEKVPWREKNGSPHCLFYDKSENSLAPWQSLCLLNNPIRGCALCFISDF